VLSIMREGADPSKGIGIGAHLATNVGDEETDSLTPRDVSPGGGAAGAWNGPEDIQVEGATGGFSTGGREGPGDGGELLPAWRAGKGRVAERGAEEASEGTICVDRTGRDVEEEGTAFDWREGEEGARKDSGDVLVTVMAGV
jgi:hypothetical protein